MINLGRLSGATFAAALLLCAFPDAIVGQEKTPPPNALTDLAVTELNVEKLRTEFDAFKRDLDKRIKDIEQTLIDQQKYVARPLPCCRYVYHHEPCCRYAYHPTPCRVAAYDPEP
jgi:hypothetical protein